MKNFLHKIAYVLVMCAAMSAFTACSDSDNKGGGPLTGTLSVETGSLKFTSGTYSKGFEVKTDGTVGAIQVDVNYKGSETGWITAKVNDGDVVVSVARNTGDARTADVVLSAKGAESVTVSISQKAVFSSDLVGRYTPYVPDPENPIANFFINPVYADMDPEKVPQIDMGFLFPGFIMPVTTVTGLANQLVGMMYGGGLTYFDFKDDGTIGAGYRDMLGFDMNAGPTFGSEVKFPNAETLEVLPVDAITYYTKDGKVYTIDAKAVVLATGDWGNNQDMRDYFVPWANEFMSFYTTMDAAGNVGNTGDGHLMGLWAGAHMELGPHAPMTHHMGSGMGVTPFLQINKRGDRFMNECIPGQQLENQIELQPECTSFQLYDSKWGEEVPYMPANHGGLCYIIPEDEDESNPNYTDRQYTKISAKAEAYQFKADTLEDLLTQCGFEGDALDNALASVERYNELAKAGSDDDFGKPASRMFALENPPYYACQWGTTSMLVCVGGLESDENCHTFTEEDPASPKRDIIKGLYVCGNVQGSRYAVEYPICMRGISHSLCVYYGYIAGKNCVAGV